jgi:hypothetical protein
MKRPARTPAQLPESLHKRLSAYAIAASAAGVGLLALTTPAVAKIVYTPVKLRILPNHRYYLEINHDGVHDFELYNSLKEPTSCTCVLQAVDVLPRQKGNQIWGANFLASALSSGVSIGSNSKLAAYNELMWKMNFSINANTYRSYGLWRNAENRYLGLKFIVKGKAVHYGWARLSVTVTGNDPPIATVVLTGYAYETIPNKPIITGKTHGKDEATLGRLALGASGVRQKQ